MTAEAPVVPVTEPQLTEPSGPSQAEVIQTLKVRSVLAVYSGLGSATGANITQQMIDLSKQASTMLFIEVTTLLPQIPEEHQEAFVQAYFEAAANIIGKNGLLQSLDRLVGLAGAKGACRIVAEHAIGVLLEIDNIIRQASQGPVMFQHQLSPQQSPQPQNGAFPQTLQQQPRGGVPVRTVSPMDEMLHNLGVRR